MKSKYRAVPVVYDGIRFHSLGECERYIELKLQEMAGAIKNLRLQVPFILAESVKINGRKVPSMKYKADFVYEEDGRQVVEDYKGVMTPVYRIKRHLMKAIHGIDILETGKRK